LGDICHPNAGEKRLASHQATRDENVWQEITFGNLRHVDPTSKFETYSPEIRPEVGREEMEAGLFIVLSAMWPMHIGEDDGETCVAEDATRER
jgi:hypothetical protein